ncbi:hypothetical protein N9X63_04045 [Woeseiaceae bacterium]|nr:hypothetical protein [Woeseiaceae bacterium]
MLDRIKEKYYLKRLGIVFRDDPEILENWKETIQNKNSPLILLPEFYKMDSIDHIMMTPKIADTGIPKFGSSNISEDKIRKDIRGFAAIWCYNGIYGAEKFFKFIRRRNNFRSIPEIGLPKIEFISSRVDHRLLTEDGERVSGYYFQEGVKGRPRKDYIDEGDKNCISTITITTELNPPLLGSKLYALCNWFKYKYVVLDGEDPYYGDEDGTLSKRQKHHIKYLIERYPELSTYFDGCNQESNIIKAYDQCDDLVIVKSATSS